MALHHQTPSCCDVPAQAVDLHDALVVGHESSSLLEELDRFYGKAGEPPRLGRCGEQPPSVLIVRSEPGRPLECCTRDCVGTSQASSRARLLERRGCGLIGPDCSCREVPCPTIGVAIGKRAGERTVSVAPVLWQRGGVDRGSSEGMPKRNNARAEPDQAGFFSGAQPAKVEVQGEGGPLEGGHMPSVVSGDKDEEPAGRGVERFGSTGEGT
jgi:hypothetical protein